MDNIYYIFILAFLFGMSFFMTYLTYNTFECFLLWLLIFVSFFVWTGLLPLWSIILLMIIDVIVIGISKYSKKGVD